MGDFYHAFSGRPVVRASCRTEGPLSTDPWNSPGSTPSVPVATSLGPLPGFPRVPFVYFWVFMAFVVFRYVDGSSRLGLFAAIRFEFLLGGTACFLAALKLSQKSIRFTYSKSIIITILLLFVAMILQLPLAWDPAEAQRVFTDRVFKFALLTFLIAALVESPHHLRLFLGAFLFSMYYITLETTEGLISGSLVWENQGIMRLHGASPMYGHPNSLAGAALGSLPFITFLFGPYKKWWIRLGLLATATTSLACVIFSGSRTGYLGLLALVGWWFFMSKHKRTFLIVGVVVGMIALAVMPDQYVERFKSIGGKEAEGNSKGTRLVILQDALTIVKEHPLGIGVASFPAIRMERFGRFQDTHNLYLEVATNLGIQGLIIFLWLVFMILQCLRRSAFSYRRQRRRLVLLQRRGGVPPPLRKALRQHAQDLVFCNAAAMAAAGFIIVRLVLGLFGMDLYEIYWWFAAGVAIALNNLDLSFLRRTRFFELAAMEFHQTRQEEASSS